MNKEDLEALIQDVSEQIESLSDPEKKLTKKEKNRKLILELQKETLNRIKTAKEKVAAGADIIVTGKIAEDNQEKLREIIQAIKGK